MLLNVNNLNFQYEQTPVLDGLSFSAEGGQLIGLIGPNGAGKSTLLRTLLGLEQPQTGELSINGQLIHKLSRKNLAQRISLVPQDAQVHYAFRVEDVVAMGRNPWLGRFQPASEQDLALVAEAMRHTDVYDFAKRPINELSGGERQRVLIARAIAQQTPIILLDEATANLDLCHQLEVLEVTRSLANDGHLIIMAMHDLSMASRYCDRLLLLAEGKLQADDSPSEVLTEQNLRQYFHLNAEITPKNPEDMSGGLQITALSPAKSRAR